MVYSGKHLHYISEILIDFDWFHHWSKGDHVQPRLLEICFEMMPIRGGIVKTIHANFGAQRKRSKSNHSNLTSSTFTIVLSCFFVPRLGKVWSSNHSSSLPIVDELLAATLQQREKDPVREVPPLRRRAHPCMPGLRCFLQRPFKWVQCLMGDDRSIEAGTSN